MSLRRPKPSIKGGPAPEEEEEDFTTHVHTSFKTLQSFTNTRESQMKT